MSGGTLVVGASQAGLQLAASLRKLDNSQPITLVGAEHYAPYQRPPLSKGVLTGEVQPADLAFQPQEFFTNAGIELVCGERIVDISLSASGLHASGIATSSTGRVFEFDRLALTVGGRARKLTTPGHDLDGICYLRGLDDATAMASRLPSAEHVVVVGGGFIGLETAAAARSVGRPVTIIEAAERLLPRAVAPVVSEFFRKAHLRRGTKVLLSTGVVAFDGHGGAVTGVHLSDGRVLPADLVVVGIGLVPNTELAEQLGLQCDGGIVVDSCARTSNPAIVAAGDCTTLPDPLTGRGRVRLESVQNAVEQARVAAATLAGRPVETRTVPWFWSDQADLKLQIAGLNTDYDDYVLRGDPDTEQFSVLYYRDDRLVAVDAVNRPADYTAVRKALGAATSIAREPARDVGRALKNLIQLEVERTTA